ncbi:MAG: hypothetical protein EOP45_13045, partial [Sphingobacteriaceae bacterium]
MTYRIKMLTFLQKNISVLDYLGQGSQGSTYLVSHKGTKYIMKLYMASIEEPSYFSKHSMKERLEYSKRYAEREEKILALLGCNDHLLCIKAKGTWSVKTKHKNPSHPSPSFRTVFEEYKEGYTDLGDLFDTNELTRNDINTITYDLIETVRFMHSKGIAHQDVKMSNIIYNPVAQDLVLIDVGAACLEKEGFCDILTTHVPENVDLLEETGIMVDRQLRNRDIFHNDRNKYSTI